MNPREALLFLVYKGDESQALLDSRYQRICKCEKLAASIGAKIYYPLNSISFYGVEVNGIMYKSHSLRDTERLLRSLKRKKC